MCVQNKMQTKTEFDATLCFHLFQHDDLHMRAARHSLEQWSILLPSASKN
jgi:hypothetical protein